MKTLSLGVAALALSLCSCGLVGKEFTVRRSVSVHASATDNLCQVDNLTFNLADDKTFADLKGNLGKVELRKVVVKVTNPKTNNDSVATKANGELKVSATLTGDKLTLGTYGDVPLTQDQTRDITYSQDAANRISELALNPPNTFFIESKGCADAKPAYFDFSVELTLYAELKP